LSICTAGARWRLGPPRLPLRKRHFYHGHGMSRPSAENRLDIASDPRPSLRVLGGLALIGPDGPIGGRAGQRRRLALLAILAHARGRPVSRDKLIALLWPETDTERA